MPHRITIELREIPYGRGSQVIVVVDPNPLYITPGDQVEWVCEDGFPFALHFDPLSPLLNRRLRAPDGVVGDQVRQKILPGKYRYLVAVARGNEIYTEDPELIDENN